jgi:hypothetical protein
MHQLLALHRHALRTDNLSLATTVARALRTDPELRERADRHLQTRARGPALWSAAAAPTIGVVMQSEIERQAERVLGEVPGWIWNANTLPVPVDQIADSCFGLHVRDVEDLRSAPGVPALGTSEGLSGLLLPSLGEIWVNAGEARDWPPRRRFTIGHELGHWCLHRHEGAVWCRKNAIDPPADDSEAATHHARRAYPPEESEANAFAAALLMPAELVRRHYERLRRQDPDDCFMQLCSLFGASGAAMSRRLRRVV